MSSPELFQELTHCRRDRLSMRFQREMARVEEADLGIRDVALERLGARWQEEGVILSPHRQEAWLVLAEVVLEGGVERDVALVVAEKIQLHFVGTWTCEVEVVESDAVRRNRSFIGHAVRVLPPRCFRRQECTQCFAVRLRWILPVGANRGPALAQTFFVGVAILGDDGRDAIGVLRRDAETRRRAVIEDVDREAIKAHQFSEAVDDAGDVVEGIFELGPRRHVRLPEPGQVRRNDVETVREQRDQIPEHVAGTREAVKQQQLGCLGSAGFAVEHLPTLDVDRTVVDGAHRVSPQALICCRTSVSNSTTVPGAVTLGIWSTGRALIRAFMRSAMNRWVCGIIIRSCSASKYQVGTSIQRGRPTGMVMQAGEIGRWIAASIACSSGEAFCANPIAKVSGGSQMRPWLSGASLGAMGCGSLM